MIPQHNVLLELAAAFYKQDKTLKTTRKRITQRVKQLSKLFKAETRLFTPTWTRFRNPNVRDGVFGSLSHPAVIAQLEILVEKGYLNKHKYNCVTSEKCATSYSFTKRADRVFERVKLPTRHRHLV